VRYAISIPQLHPGGTFDPGRFRAYMRRSEELGFESAWTSEQVVGTAPLLGPIELMTYAAACTEHIRLGCSMHILPLYSPLHLAKSLASLDQLSRGRLDVGIGVGGTSRPFAAFAVDPKSVVARFNESLAVIERVWTEPAVTFQGRFWTLENISMEPKPFQKPRPPIWFGAAAPPALRRAVRRGDGFMGAGSQTTGQFAEQMRVVQEAISQSGRTDFRIAKRVYIAVDDDEERARSRMSEALQVMYGYFGIKVLDAAVCGPPSACVARLREIKALGAQLILLNPLFDDMDQMERLASEVTTAEL
jgi:probable F420-dependent oxidoreductase